MGGFAMSGSNRPQADGRRAIFITGAASGIGLATAKRFVGEGAYAFITGRRPRELDAAVREMGRM